uniref:General transcription factor IIF subunit 2 n=1 Tax=Strigamia maritima TaxID=126957 RepID=T1JAL0_STRMM
MDCVNGKRGLWLVKVPKYITVQWYKSTTADVGKLSISKVVAPLSGSGSESDIRFVLNDCLVQNADDRIPKEHKFVITNNNNAQKLLVYSQNGDKLCLEGTVVERAECRPSNNDKDYMQLKKLAISRASQPLRTVKQLDRVVNTYKPVSDHKNNIEFNNRKKTEGKNMRTDKEKVTEILFKAFEKHQYYAIKDLVGITRQPLAYLKQILKEFCNYNVTNSHKNKWELKPEYRHYKE